MGHDELWTKHVVAERGGVLLLLSMNLDESASAS
jgi:hypothetical protein